MTKNPARVACSGIPILVSRYIASNPFACMEAVLSRSPSFQNEWVSHNVVSTEEETRKAWR
jgi:hypothetical protein